MLCISSFSFGINLKKEFMSIIKCFFACSRLQSTSKLNSICKKVREVVDRFECLYQKHSTWLICYFIEMWKFTVWKQFCVSDTIIDLSESLTQDIWILIGNHQWFLSLLSKFSLAKFLFYFFLQNFNISFVTICESKRSKLFIIWWAF